MSADHPPDIEESREVLYLRCQHVPQLFDTLSALGVCTWWQLGQLPETYWQQLLSHLSSLGLPAGEGPGLLKELREEAILDSQALQKGFNAFLMQPVIAENDEDADDEADS